MSPVRTRKERNSSGPAKAVVILSPNTPERDSRQQAPNISEAQKQALIDNLQLEITERARKLRAQYSLHAQGLRSRLEMRINRIPQNLRNANIEDLINKYSEHLEPPKTQTLPAPKPVFSRTTTASSKESIVIATSPMRRGLKRSSSDQMDQSDKENMQAGDLDLPRKRAKAAPVAAAPAVAKARAVSRKVDPSKVLSPKSHNSRTYPQSPVKLASPGKSGLTRPVSPIKSGTVAAATASLASLVSANENQRLGRSAATASSRTASKQTVSNTGTIRIRGGRAGAMAPPPVPPKQVGRGRTASQSSQTSDSSAHTTIIRKAGTVRKAVSKATGMTAAAAGKRTLTKKEIPAPSATGTGGRVLRTRR